MQRDWHNNTKKKIGCYPVAAAAAAVYPPEWCASAWRFQMINSIEFTTWHDALLVSAYEVMAISLLVVLTAYNKSIKPSFHIGYLLSIFLFLFYLFFFAFCFSRMWKLNPTSFIKSEKCKRWHENPFDICTLFSCVFQSFHFLLYRYKMWKFHWKYYDMKIGTTIDAISARNKMQTV